MKYVRAVSRIHMLILGFKGLNDQRKKKREQVIDSLKSLTDLCISLAQTMLVKNENWIIKRYFDQAPLDSGEKEGVL